MAVIIGFIAGFITVPETTFAVFILLFAIGVFFVFVFLIWEMCGDIFG
tara:strand:+ start:104 stop:247 length:144 start_codon:yes stop_codon:yes gene_type:complete